MAGRWSAAVVTGGLALLAAACSTPVSPSDHPEAGGVVIFDASGATVLARSVGEGQPFSAPLTIPAGQALEVQIRFLDADDPNNDALAFMPDADEGESLRVGITNTGLVQYQDQGDHGNFVAGAATGQTTAVIALRHGSHDDFTSGNLTIVVE